MQLLKFSVVKSGGVVLWLYSACRASFEENHQGRINIKHTVGKCAEEAHTQQVIMLLIHIEIMERVKEKNAK